ncbi:protein Spindly [Aedes albopictus]|uniref:Uncharacterized protein n=1 Tax=Aedes albopictus TaxID=7160 RepID=A0ABM1YEZ3_AEDAL|nr:protein Spindly [Aedes albopictus]KXJ74844.1 hypothetical protein RP20_CCG012860 [Aedes albopictus]
MSAANQTIIADIQSLTGDELAEQYRRLADAYRTLKRAHEDELQASYELRRNYQTASESVTYMSAELESIDSVHKEELAKLKEKYVLTLTGLKDSNADLKQYNSTLEATVDDLQKQTSALKEKIEELEAGSANSESVTGNSTLNSEKEAFLERENEELKQAIAEQQEKIDTLMLQLVNSESTVENLKEKIECVEDNLSSKRQELEEIRTLLDSTQEENMRLNGEIAALRSAPQDANKKGNSLFAEVDDQRQKMIEMLQSQRKRYTEMKKLYSESQFQIRRLTRENEELCNEIKACSELFAKADNTFRDESSRQISSLGKDVQQLREQLAATERRLLEKANDINWVDPFVSFYRNESGNLKTALFQSQMAKRLVDEICWEAQRDLAKWRFEALKSRYIIINRESLLEEHGIAFETLDAFQLGIHIDEATVAKATPHVGFTPAVVKSTQEACPDLNPLGDLENDLNSLALDELHHPSPLILPPPPPPMPLSKPPTKQLPEKVETITPLATPLVTPIQSPKSDQKSSKPLTNPLPYRDIVFIPKNAPLTDSLKKKNFAEMLEKTQAEDSASKSSAFSAVKIADDEEKENLGRRQQEQDSAQSKAWGWISEKRTKNNIVVRRFKFPERKFPVEGQKEA